MKSQSGENRTKHHTNLYQSHNLVIRRGQPFQMWVTLSRPLDRNTDALHLDLKTGGSWVGGLDHHNFSPPIAHVACSCFWFLNLMQALKTKLILKKKNGTGIKKLYAYKYMYICMYVYFFLRLFFNHMMFLRC